MRYITYQLVERRRDAVEALVQTALVSVLSVSLWAVILLVESVRL